MRTHRRTTHSRSCITGRTTNRPRDIRELGRQSRPNTSTGRALSTSGFQSGSPHRRRIAFEVRRTCCSGTCQSSNPSRRYTLHRPFRRTRTDHSLLHHSRRQFHHHLARHLCSSEYPEPSRVSSTGWQSRQNQANKIRKLSRPGMSHGCTMHRVACSSRYSISMTKPP